MSPILVTPLDDSAEAAVVQYVHARRHLLELDLDAETKQPARTDGRYVIYVVDPRMDPRPFAEDLADRERARLHVEIE